MLNDERLKDIRSKSGIGDYKRCYYKNRGFLWLGFMILMNSTRHWQWIITSYLEPIIILVRCVNLQCRHFWNCSLGCELNLNWWRWAWNWWGCSSARIMFVFSLCLCLRSLITLMVCSQLDIHSLATYSHSLWLFCLFVVILFLCYHFHPCSCFAP